MEVSRIKIITTMDRHYMTHDILTVFRKYKISITWMEVYTFIIYLKFPPIKMKKWKEIKKDLLNVPEVKEIEEIDLIAVEEREIEMKTVLDIVSQGIIVLDKNGRIKYINKYASEKVFLVAPDKAVDEKITRYLRDNTVGDIIEGVNKDKVVENLEVRINHHEYFINMNPVSSSEDIFFGYIITIQDMKKIGELIDDKRYDNPITFENIKGNSDEILEVINYAKLFAPSSSPVLITGESGTGKELFARSIHNYSRRAEKIFIPINCAAIPDQLLESELFGYEDGSFTGGKKGGKRGILEIAEGGTIFLDEIGEMAQHIQVKLLRVLQEGAIRRIGSHKEIPIDVRVLSATNQNIEEMVKEGKFRLDLLYRINVFKIDIPPLRERPEDCKVLVEHFKSVYENSYNKKIKGIEEDAMNMLLSYSWPGNIRELQNVLERAVALEEKEYIQAKHIFLNYNLEAKKSKKSRNLTKSVEAFEKSIIEEALKEHGSIRKTARALGVTHTLLFNRMKKYDVKS